MYWATGCSECSCRSLSRSCPEKIFIISAEVEPVPPDLELSLLGIEFLVRGFFQTEVSTNSTGTLVAFSLTCSLVSEGYFYAIRQLWTDIDTQKSEFLNHEKKSGAEGVLKLQYVLEVIREVLYIGVTKKSVVIERTALSHMQYISATIICSRNINACCTKG